MQEGTWSSNTWLCLHGGATYVLLILGVGIGECGLREAGKHEY